MAGKKSTSGSTEVSQEVAKRPAINYQIVRTVAVPSISMKSRESFLFLSLGAIHEGTPLTETDKRTGEVVQLKPAIIMQVTDLETGKMHDFMMPTVLEAILNREYGYLTSDGKPGYIGKCFCATKSRREGKKYDDYALDEIKMLNSETESLELLQDQSE